jgi:hypothetical protein
MKKLDCLHNLNKCSAHNSFFFFSLNTVFAQLCTKLYIYEYIWTILTLLVSVYVIPPSSFCHSSFLFLAFFVLLSVIPNSVSGIPSSSSCHSSFFLLSFILLIPVTLPSSFCYSSVFLLSFYFFCHSLLYFLSFL